MNCAISGYINPVTALANNYPNLRTTQSVYETVIIGYESVCKYVYNDGLVSYHAVLFATENQAKKHLSTMHTNLF